MATVPEPRGREPHTRGDSWKIPSRKIVLSALHGGKEKGGVGWGLRRIDTFRSPGRRVLTVPLAGRNVEAVTGQLLGGGTEGAFGQITLSTKAEQTKKLLETAQLCELS